MDAAYLQERITKTKAQIAAYEDAITALATGGAQEYSLDTGQSTQRVTKLDVFRLQSVVDSLYNRLDALTTRYCGPQGKIGVPGF